MLPKGLVQEGFDHMTIGRMTCDQTRREPRGPVGSESTYGLLPGQDRDMAFGLAEMRGRTGRRAWCSAGELGRTGTSVSFRALRTRALPS